ncbi:RDD family protein [Streptomyces gibsoniae]|uniref:RDD family protein n=1 Tax=Streptomyces gibsoniae TaxID=3075529 RepID=A0ABU2TLL4_9ACTN|nr:RDD family protein [Streptomyces sp. DSM 41699]MDT0461805.1 RDD family protein [Streptomyces sp. DSM 41699]
MSFGSPNNPYGQPQNPQQGYGYPQQGQQPGYGYPQAPGVPPQGAYGYPQDQGYAGPPAPRVASMGRRFGARLIDGAVFAVIYGVLAVVGVAGAVGEAKNCDPNAVDYNTCINNAGSDFAAKFGAIIGVLAIIGLLYEWLMVGLVGRTLGKMAVGLHVVNAETGGKPGLGKSFIRWIIPTVGSVLCGIGQLLVYLSPFWDKSGRQQGWHDKAAGTMVIQN